MSDLTATTAADILAACTAGGAEAASALGRSLGGAWTAGKPTEATFAADAPPAGFDGPGLVVLLTVAGAGLAICLPESTGLLPGWAAAPDATGESKLAALAQELSMLLVPETLAADKFEARCVANLSAALTAAGAASNGAAVELPIECSKQRGTLHIIWPLSSPAACFAATGAASAASTSPTARGAKARSLGQLPHYSRSLLKIRIPVSVHLASKRETVQEIVELVPGAIIKFDKGCDELLQMVIGGQQIAEGEAVKIGDKFGFRVTGMMMPREHFVPARRPRAG
jgi:flagellar motor switch protein FliN/FliY